MRLAARGSQQGARLSPGINPEPRGKLSSIRAEVFPAARSRTLSRKSTGGPAAHSLFRVYPCFFRGQGLSVETRLVVDLPEGPHRVEVRKDGFRTYTTTVHVRRGQTVTVNVSLSSVQTPDD
jgi:hypothetical protein